MLPTAAIPKPRPHFPLRTALKLNQPRPSLSLITNFEKPIPLRMRFQAPQLGALGVTFTTFRALQFVSLVAIIGLTANFISEIVSARRDAPDVLVGTLVVVSPLSYLQKYQPAIQTSPLTNTH